MNRLDTTQIEIPRRSTAAANAMIPLTYVVGTVALLVPVVVGIAGAHNPTDRTFAVLALLPWGCLGVDLWTAAVAFLRRGAATPLRIPLKTPLILAGVHILCGLAGSAWTGFDTLYALDWADERVGHYQVRWGVATGVVVLSGVSLVLAAFETRLLRWVLISEITSAAPAAPAQEAEDIPLGDEHIYEAQVLLNNLGYDVAPITGELTAATEAALRAFQSVEGLEETGALSAKSMIELRNRWREKEEDGNRVKAVSEHAIRRTGSRIAGLFRRS